MIGQSSAPGAALTLTLTVCLMAEALAAAYGVSAIYEGAQSFYAGYQAVNTVYSAYKYFYPTSESRSPNGEFIRAGDRTLVGGKRRKRFVRRRYYRRY